MTAALCSRRRLLGSALLIGLSTGCRGEPQGIVTSTDQLNRALANAQPGDEIVLADGNYAAPRPITRGGTSNSPIVIRAANILGPMFTDGIFQVDADHVVLQGLDFVSCAVQAGYNSRAANFRLWRCRFRQNGSSENFAIRLYNAPDFDGAYCQVGPQWRGRGFGFSIAHGSLRPTWRHSMFRDTPSGFRSGDGEAMHYSFGPPEARADGLVYRCKFKNWRSDPEIISIKCSEVLIKQCCAEDCIDSAFNIRFGTSNTLEGCWTRNSWGIGARDGYNNAGQGKQNKILGCIVENVTNPSRGIYTQRGTWLPPDDRPSGAHFPVARNLVISGCTGPVNDGFSHSTNNEVAPRDTRIRQHTGGPIASPGGIGIDSQPNVAETLYEWSPPIWLEDDDVGPLAG